MSLGVFSKNYPIHLEAAAEIGAANPDQLVTFRSDQKWKSAQELVNTVGKGAVPVVFAVNGEGPQVRYRAWLHEVVLEPAPDDSRSLELLSLRPHTTEHEDPWADELRTLYAIAGCRELVQPLPYASLLKRDGTPIKDNYKYSYSIIQADLLEGLSLSHSDSGVDLSAPPVRVDAVISRIVRDTALTQRLKALHDNRCQVCSTRLQRADGIGYAEAHHLQPLGRPHEGPDIASNIVILCPNCHALCDLRALSLDLGKLHMVPGHKVDEAFVRYSNGLSDHRRKRVRRRPTRV